MRRRDVLGAGIAALTVAGAGAALAQSRADWGPSWLSDTWRRLFGKAARRPGGVFYITPEGAGARDGTSWDSAGTLAQLPEFIADCSPGGEVRLAAELGPYPYYEAISIRDGGGRGAPTVVRGVSRASGEAAPAQIVGIRAERFTPEAEKGEECFRLLSGADHLRFRSLAFRNVGNGCFRIGGRVRDLAIEDCTFHNVYRFLENTVSGGGGDATLTGFAVRRCSGTRIERSFARLRYGTAFGRIERCSADSQGLEGDSFAVGCALDDGAHDITYVDCVMENFRQSGGRRYWNGDGFSDEPGNYNIRYERCAARGSTDGGFDCKSANLVLLECVAEDNKRNFRIWGENARLLSCTSRKPNWRGEGQENGGPAHVWVGGRGAKHILLDRFTAESDNAFPLFVGDCEQGGVVQAPNHRFAVPAETALLDNEGAPLRIELG